MSTAVFQKISKEIQERKIWVYEQTNGDNLRAAKEEFYRDKDLVFPHFKHEEKKILTILQNIYALAVTIPNMIDQHKEDITRTEYLVMSEARSWALKSNIHAAKVLSRSFPNLDALLKNQPEELRKYFGVDQFPDVDAALNKQPEELQANFGASSSEPPFKWAPDKESLEADSQNYYGYSPDRTLLLALLHDTLMHMMSNKANWGDEEPELLTEIKQILSAHQLDGAWAVDPEFSKRIYHPKEKTMRKFGELAKYGLSSILLLLPMTGAVHSADEVVKLTNAIFAANGTKFRCEKDEKGHIFSIEQGTKIAKVPEERSKGPIDDATLYATWGGHEVGIHIGRGLRYENTEISELATGFTSYEAIEEGIAKCVEKSLLFCLGDANNQANRSAIDYYVNIGLAHCYGFNYRELCDLRRDIIYLTNINAETNCTVLMSQAMNNSYDQIRRVFRGTGDVIDYKDLFYYLAEEQVWRFIERYIDEYPAELWLTLTGLGKTNFLDRGTRNILRAIMQSDDFSLAKEQLTRGKNLLDSIDADEDDEPLVTHHQQMSMKSILAEGGFDEAFPEL